MNVANFNTKSGGAGGNKNNSMGTSINCNARVGSSSSSSMASPGLQASLTRQSSSPTGFLNHLSSDHHAGFSFARGGENYSTSEEGQSFKHHDQAWRLSMNFATNGPNTSLANSSHERSPLSRSNSTNNAGFSISPWDDGEAFVFSTHSSKRAKNVDPDLLSSLSAIESQIDLSQTDLEMGTLQIPEDSTPCKLRAKRGCATHPRSIAERERRTRISGKLKKLQELVPNMDRQTSYAEMLDLAVQHIKGLQTQIENLNGELKSCTCGCKQRV